MKHFLMPALLLVATLLLPRSAQAFEADARDYEGLSSAPNGTVAVWNYLRHDTTSAGPNVTQNLAVYRATYILRFGDLTVIPFDMGLGVVDATLSVPLSNMAPQPTGNIQQTGLADLQYFPTIGYNHVENKQDNTHTYAGITFFLTMPTGTYSAPSAVNIGQNRWAYKPQVVVGQRFAKIFTAELVGNLELYGQNNNYMVPTMPQLGKQTLNQNLSYHVALHLAADVDKTMWVGTSLYVYSSGAQSSNLSTPLGTMPTTIANQGVVETLRFTWGIHIEKQTLMLLQFNQDVHASGGLSKTRFFGVRLSHFFW